MGRSTSTTYNVAADTEATNIVGSSGSAAARDEAVSVGGSGNAAAKDSGVAQSAGANSVLNTGISGNENSTVTIGYDAGQFQTALQTVGSNLTSAVNSQSAAGKETLNTVLGQLTSLAESKQTDGESGRNNVILYIALAVLAVVGVYFYRNK